MKQSRLEAPLLLLLQQILRRKNMLFNISGTCLRLALECLLQLQVLRSKRRISLTSEDRTFTGISLDGHQTEVWDKSYSVHLSLFDMKSFSLVLFGVFLCISLSSNFVKLQPKFYIKFNVFFPSCKIIKNIQLLGNTTFNDENTMFQGM